MNRDRALPTPGDSLRVHLGEAHVSWDSHVHRRIVSLGRELASRKAIYLDLRFWIGLREAARRDHRDSWGALLEELRRAVHAGAAFCPLSDSTFLEIFKQEDDVSRAQTASLVGELSLGVCLVAQDLRVGTEIAHMLHTGMHSTKGLPSSSGSLHPLEHLVWSKVGVALGFVQPTRTGFPPDTELAIQKGFFDHMWDAMALSTIDAFVGREPGMRDSLQLRRIADRLNDGILTHSAGLKSFRQTYEEELIGVVDLFGDRVRSVLAEFAPPEAGPPPGAATPEAQDLHRHCVSFLMAVCKTESGRKALRTIHIMTCLHAALRWNKTQKIKPNDLFDFQHAAAGVGYCDAFFTEGPLRSMLTRSDLRLDREFGCLVTDDVDQALSYVREI